MKALVVCNHPGGARVVFPVVQELRSQNASLTFIYALTHNSFGEFHLTDKSKYKLFSKEQIDANNVGFSFFEGVDFLLTGTSIHGNFEKAFIEKAKRLNKITFSILDHWCAYRERFDLTNAGRNLPDYIYVPDELAHKDLLENGVSEKKIIISGHPAFDIVVEKKRNLTCLDKVDIREQLGLSSDKKMLLFISEPAESDHALTPKSSEFYALEQICEVLLSESLYEDWQIVIKLHPRESGQKYKDLKSRYDGIDFYEPGATIDRHKIVFASDVVFGLDSMLMLEAAFLGVPVYAFCFEKGYPMSVSLRKGVAESIQNRKELAKALGSYKGRATLLVQENNASEFIAQDLCLKLSGSAG